MRFFRSFPLRYVFPFFPFLVGCPMADEASSPAPATTPTANPTPLPDAGSPDVDSASPTPKATHTGLVSIQDVAIANLPAAGHGLTVNVFFNALRAPDYDERPGEPTGCKAWVYDLTQQKPPALEDHGTITLGGLEGGNVQCTFDAARGYTCPTANGNGAVAANAAVNGQAAYTLSGAKLSAADVGRYLALSGATNAANNGAFAITEVKSATEVVVANSRAASETFTGGFAIVAGAGPTPGDRYRPFGAGNKIVIGLVPGGGGAFAFPDVALTPGDEFTLDTDAHARIMALPLTGEAVTLGCSGCGQADGTVIRITTTDADLTGASPVAMPPATKRYVEISCVEIGKGTISIPAPAMALLKSTNEASRITRLRTAFMRDGLAVVANAPPRPQNRVSLAVGRGLIGFTTP